jgi:hypothetical protein
MSNKSIAAAITGLLVVFAFPAVYAQVPTTYDMEKVAPRKDEPKKPAPRKAPPAEAQKAEKTQPPAKAEKAKQVSKTYSTGPTVLRDKDGNVIPTNPDAYPVDSAQGSSKARR